MLYRALSDKVAGIWDLLRFTVTGRGADSLFILMMGIAATLLGMIAPRATGTLVDTAIPSADTRLVWQLAMMLVAAGVAAAFCTYLQVMATVRTSITTEVVSQSAIWDRLLKLRPNFLRGYSSGDLETRVNVVSEVSREVSAATLRPLISGVLALLNWLLLWYYSWELARIALYIGLAVLVLTLVAGHFIRKLSFRLNDLEGSFNGMMIQMIGGVGKLRVAGGEHRAFNYWVARCSGLTRLRQRVKVYKDLIHIFTLILPTLAAVVMFWKATKLTIDLPHDDPEKLTIGDFIAFNTAFLLYLTGWSDVSNTIVSLLDAAMKARRVRPLLEAEPEVDESASDPGRLKGAIKLEGVSFRYAADGPLILDNLSLEIGPGEFVAFVGPSGSGKSTLLRLLLGFEKPEAGRILYDGQDLGGLDVLSVRRQIGTVLQNGRLNSAPLIDNISNNAKITQAEAWEAAADAGLSDDIEQMPMGLHTVVAEGGANLSGGQRQRVLIARALVTRPKIVYFDEATSALDNKTQATVSQALDRRKVTRVVIAHRLSTIYRADRIYVLDRGVIVQQGTFDELSRQEGLFKDLMARQRT
jgi:ATP-binding cassette subfamily C protein